MHIGEPMCDPAPVIGNMCSTTFKTCTSLDSHVDECEPALWEVLPADTFLDIGCSPTRSPTARILPHGAVLGHLRDLAPCVDKDEQVLAIGATSDNTAQLIATTHKVSGRENLPIELHVV